MFNGLNAIPWVDLTHAYGSAEEVPMWLRQLASGNEETRKQAIWHLTGSICHQGWISPATGYAVPYLIELLREPTVQEKEALLELLAEIAEADPELDEGCWRKNAGGTYMECPRTYPFQKYAGGDIQGTPCVSCAARCNKPNGTFTSTLPAGTSRGAISPCAYASH